MTQLKHLIKKRVQLKLPFRNVGNIHICRNACYNAAFLPNVTGISFSGKSGHDFYVTNILSSTDVKNMSINAHIRTPSQLAGLLGKKVTFHWFIYLQ